MSANYVLSANNVSFEDFLAAQRKRHDDFSTVSHAEFYSAVDSYFSSRHELPDEILQERKDKVKYFLL